MFNAVNEDDIERIQCYCQSNKKKKGNFRMLVALC